MRRERQIFLFLTGILGRRLGLQVDRLEWREEELVVVRTRARNREVERIGTDMLSMGV